MFEHQWTVKSQQVNNLTMFTVNYSSMFVKIFNLFNKKVE